MNKKILKCASVMLALVAAFGTVSLTACETNATETPVHHIMVPADCYSAGNIEYWTQGDKYYNDEACTNEITQADTIIQKRDHDFGTDASYGHDDQGNHWKVCAYADCNGTDNAEPHVYTDGKCVCGVTEKKPTPTAYAITVNAAENGSVTADKTEAAAGETVTLTVTPDKGYHLGSLKYGGTDVDVEEGAYTFTMPDTAVTVTATFTAHVFTDGRCECGATNGFENSSVAYYSDETTDLGVTRTDTADSMKISATNPNGTDWHIKLYTVIGNITVGHYYEITYTIDSNVEGVIGFELDGGAYYKASVSDFIPTFNLQNGTNTVKFRFAVGKDMNNGAEGTTPATNPALNLGALSAFELTVTGIECRELTTDLSAYTLGVIDGQTSGTQTRANDNKEFTIAASGTNVDWYLKINHNLVFETDKTYEMTYVFTSDKSGNTKFEAANTNFTEGNGWNWANGGVNVITVRFTASIDTGASGQYSSLNLGELLGDGSVNITFNYIELKEVA